MSKFPPTFVWVHKLFDSTSNDFIENEIASFVEFKLWK